MSTDLEGQRSLLMKEKTAMERHNKLKAERERREKELQVLIKTVQARNKPQPAKEEAMMMGLKPLSQIIFETHDADKSGFIEPVEFRNLCYDCGQFMSGPELASVFDSIDKDNKGGINYEQFMTWWRKSHKFGGLHLTDADLAERKKAVELFHRFDEDTDGSIDMFEFPAFYSGLMKADLLPPDKNRQQCMEELDRDHSGDISLNEFIEWLRACGTLGKRMKMVSTPLIDHIKMEPELFALGLGPSYTPVASSVPLPPDNVKPE
jgi:Ca2+-binding EF-hand superfamily protein